MKSQISHTACLELKSPARIAMLTWVINFLMVLKARDTALTQLHCNFMPARKCPLMNNSPIGDLDIVFENDELLAVNKPANLSFHTESQQLGVATKIQQATNQTLWPVHRLDKITSGLLLFAKSKNAAVEINRLFAERKIEKVYIALSANKPKKKQGKIIGDMVKTRNGSWKLTQENSNPAITQFFTRSLKPGIRFFWIKPTTGKTHQIRVALKSLGAPILGDERYGGKSADRGYLHAYQLQFEWRGEILEINCPPAEGELFSGPELEFCIKQSTNKGINKNI